MSADYTFKWNEKQVQFIAKYREFGTGVWKTKRIPKKEAGRGEDLSAERWLRGWYERQLRQGGLAPRNDEVVPLAKTIRFLAPRWAEFRNNHTGTAFNTYTAYLVILRNWILDNPQFDHLSIQDLDVEKDFTPAVCEMWIKSMDLHPTTKIRYVGCLKSFFTDAMVQGWISDEKGNPFDHVRIRALLKDLRKQSEGLRKTTVIGDAQLEALLTNENPKIPRYRVARYWVAGGTGMRDNEIQGLTFADLNLDAETPHLWVRRQLLKPGPLPATDVSELQARGISKEDWKTWKTAIVGPPKYGSQRCLPLHPDVVEAMKAWKKRWTAYVGRRPQPGDPVFASGARYGHQRPGGFSVSDSSDQLKKDLKRLGFKATAINPETTKEEPLGFHSLRRWHASNLAANDVSTDMVGELLGHQGKGTAQRHYIQGLVEKRYEAVLKLKLPTSNHAEDEPSNNVYPFKKRGS